MSHKEVDKVLKIVEKQTGYPVSVKAIVLSSINTEHEDIVISGEKDFSVIGVFERVVVAP
jgi:hypothetical protein